MVSKKVIKYLKKLHREETKNVDLTTKVMEDKRTKRNRTRSEQERNAIKDGIQKWEDDQ